MRRAGSLLTILAALALWLLAGACSHPGGLVILDPQDPQRDYDVDLGQIQYGEVREHVVRMRNAEGRPVAIRQVTAGCSCTTPRLAYTDAKGEHVDGPRIWGEEPFVLPAEAILEVNLKVDSRAVPAHNAAKRVLVRIQSDSEVDPSKTLEVHMWVEMPFYVVPRVIDLGQVPLGGIAVGKTEISRAMGTGELITGIREKPDGMDVALETPEQLGSMMWRLNVRWFPPFQRGTQTRTVVLGTSGPQGVGEGRPLEITVQALGVEDVIAEPMLFSVPHELAPDCAAGSVKLRSMVGGNRLFLTGTRIEGPQAECFRATYVAVDPDSAGRSETWIVALTCARPPSAPGTFSGQVVVLLDDPVYPEVRVPYVYKDQP